MRRHAADSRTASTASCTAGSHRSTAGRSAATTGPGQTEEFWILDVEGTRLVLEKHDSPDVAGRRTSPSGTPSSTRSASSPDPPADRPTLALGRSVHRSCARIAPVRFGARGWPWVDCTRDEVPMALKRYRVRRSPTASAGTIAIGRRSSTSSCPAASVAASWPATSPRTRPRSARCATGAPSRSSSRWPRRCSAAGPAGARSGACCGPWTTKPPCASG